MATENGCLLPEDVIIEILSLLPVKTLLQFKCVCKSWYGIITSSNFISLHLNNHYNNIKSGHLLAHFVYPQLLELFQDESLTDLSHQELDAPIRGRLCGRLCGPCNGIFYVDSEDSSGSGLWNPATKEFKLLPEKIRNKSSLPLYYDDSYGFGFDPVTNDYKVVVIRESYTREYYLEMFSSSLVIVYTLRTDSWRCWGSLDQGYTLADNFCYTNVDGVSYWRASHGVHRNVILSFNMATEAFQEIQEPDYDKPAHSTLILYHDSIAFSTVHDIEKFLDIWVLNEGCWIRQFKSRPLLEVQNPVAHWKNGNVILDCETDQLMLYDTNKQELKDLRFKGTGVCHEILVYRESLVSIKDGIGCRQHEEHLLEHS
uniref:F-box domain-containing protein n=1 Tax=Populus alba TaxID=43335 RepID=A0A4U5QSE4_POPAL|nr:hypothetical protein D5086_0000048270 [Populus alba]